MVQLLPVDHLVEHLACKLQYVEEMVKQNYWAFWGYSLHTIFKMYEQVIKHVQAYFICPRSHNSIGYATTFFKYLFLLHVYTMKFGY